VADESAAAQLALHAQEQVDFDAEESQSSGDRDPRSPRGSQK